MINLSSMIEVAKRNIFDKLSPIILLRERITLHDQRSKYTRQIEIVRGGAFECRLISCICVAHN